MQLSSAFAHRHGVVQGASFAAEMCMNLGYMYPTTKSPSILSFDGQCGTGVQHLSKASDKQISRRTITTNVDDVDALEHRLLAFMFNQLR